MNHAVLKSVSAFLLGSCLLSSLAIADSSENTIRVFVRTIEASEDTAHKSAIANASAVTPPIVIDNGLEDIKAKLSSLPYQNFKLLATKQKDMNIKGKENMSLPNGQVLTFRPMYVENKRVGLWLNWKDSSGAEILNTRIHFDCDESVLTGTDSSPETGLILAIKAAPVKN